MKKKKTISESFITIATLVLFFACYNSQQLSAQTTIVVDPTQTEEILFSEIFNSVRYIKLETTDDILIREISAIRYANNSIFIMDRFKGAISSFDATTGKKLWKVNINQRQSGCAQLLDFDIDEKNNRLYLLLTLGRIQEYDLYGNFIKEHNIEVFGLSVAGKDGYLYIYAGNRSNIVNGQKEFYHLLIYNKNTGLLKGALPFEDVPNRRLVRFGRLMSAFYHYNDEVRFFMPYSQNIYSMRGDNVRIAYQFDFGNYNLPTNLNQFTDEFQQLLDVRRDASQMSYVFGLHSAWENEQYLSIAIRKGTRQIQILYSKQNQRVRVSNFFSDDMGISPTVVLATDNFVLGYRSPRDIFRVIDFFKELNVSNDEQTLVQKIANDITENSNPIIFFYYFRR